MDLAFPTAVAVVALALALWLGRRRAARPDAPAAPREPDAEDRATVVLDIGNADPRSESVRRLVREAAARALARSPKASEAVVLDRDGTVLARVPAKAPEPRATSFPPVSAFEPHVVHGAAEPSSGLEGEVHPSVTPRFEARERPKPKQRLADSFDLPEQVRAAVRDPDDAVEIVRAILDVAGLAAVVTGEVVRSGAHVFVVVPERVGRTMHDALNNAFLRFRDTGAASGVVLALGMLDPTEVRRRELMAPALRHAGREAIQRMADAVAVGADPIAFVHAPALIEPEPPGRRRRAG